MEGEEMKSKLHLIDHDEPTRQQVAMARIEQAHREYRTDTGAPWRPIEPPRGLSPLIRPEGMTGCKVVVVDGSVPLWRKAWRWLASKAK
jgi:hypothetical protein